MDSSVPPTIFSWITDFAKRFVQVLSIDDEEFRVGLLAYSTNAHPEFHLNEYKTKTDILNGIDRVTYRPGQTDTAQAFRTVHQQMFRPHRGDRDFARNYIVLVTGNDQSTNTLRTQTAVDRVKQAGTAVLVVGLDIKNACEVDDIASKPTHSYQFLRRGQDDLMNVPKPLAARIRQCKLRCFLFIDNQLLGLVFWKKAGWLTFVMSYVELCPQKTRTEQVFLLISQ